MNSVELTHDMTRDRASGDWRCIYCGRRGTIRYINEIRCRALPPKSVRDENLLAAIRGELK